MPRIPRPWYAIGAWRTDFGNFRNRVLFRGPEDVDTRFLAEKELLRLREEAKLFQNQSGMNTPFGQVVEQFLEDYSSTVSMSASFTMLRLNLPSRSPSVKILPLKRTKRIPPRGFKTCRMTRNTSSWL